MRGSEDKGMDRIYQRHSSYAVRDSRFYEYGVLGQVGPDSYANLRSSSRSTTRATQALSARRRRQRAYASVIVPISATLTAIVIISAIIIGSAGGFK